MPLLLVWNILLFSLFAEYRRQCFFANGFPGELDLDAGIAQNKTRTFARLILARYQSVNVVFHQPVGHLDSFCLFFPEMRIGQDKLFDDPASGPVHPEQSEKRRLPEMGGNGLLILGNGNGAG